MAPAKKKSAKPKKKAVKKVVRKAAPAPRKAPAPKVAAPKPAPKPVPIVSKEKFLKRNPTLAPLYKKLVERKYQITGQVGNLENDLRDEMADTQNTPGDLADHGSGELNQHLSVTLMENDRIELERLDRALIRFDENNYGRCEMCDKPIPMMRLKAIPWATRCINCQSRAEHG